MIWPSESTEKLFAGAPPKLTAVVPLKSCPLIVTEVPPRIEPDEGLSEEIPGSGWTSALNASSWGPKCEPFGPRVEPSASDGNHTAIVGV